MSRFERKRAGRSHRLAGRQRRLSLEQLEDRLPLAVVINELVADNQSGITDFAGQRQDWIELLNTGPATVDISGWYLTDSASNLTKWQIPATSETQSLGPGEFLLVFASGKDGVFSDELHASFSLSSDGEYLGLVQSNGTTVVDAYNPFPAVGADVSFGRGYDATSTSSETILNTGAPARYRPFTGPNQAVDDHWLEIDYDDSGWSAATNGMGFGFGAPWQNSTISLNGEISAYVRLPFTVNNHEQLTSMELELRVDNGYILFLNGREVRRERVQTDLKIGNDWELNARQNVSNSSMLNEPSVIDLTPWLDTLKEGDNVLAIYAANHTSDTSDFLVHARMTAERATNVVAGRFMPDPTPGETNGAGYLGILDDTTFSHDRGFYDQPFFLTITTSEPDATIRYTTDGSQPTLTNGSTYTGPITIHPDNFTQTVGVVTLRAAAFKAGYASTNADTQTYIFLDELLSQQIDTLDNPIDVPPYAEWGVGGEPDWDIDPNIVNSVGAAELKSSLQAIPTMSLVMNWEDLFGNAGGGDNDHGIYTVTDRWREKSDERAASLEFFTADENEEFQIDAAVEIQGHSSARRWNSDKLSFQVKFKAPYDRVLESNTLFRNSAVDGIRAATQFDTLILDAQYNYTWVHANPAQHQVAKYINDQVVSDLINLAGGRSPHGRWVHLYINGLYWGIYNAHERPDDSFAAAYYGGKEDDYYVVKAADGVNMAHGGTHPEYLQVDGGLAAEAAYAQLLDQVDDNLANLSQYNEVAALLDVDRFIDYMIVHYYAGNYDWGQDNWYASLKHTDAGAKWHFHSWDQEHAWPTDDNAPYGDNRGPNYDHTGFDEGPSGPTGIHHQLMASSEYRLRFSDRVEELLQNGGLLTPSAAAAVFQARIDELAQAIHGEAARWGDNRANENASDWLANVQGVLSDFFPVRTANVLAQFANRGWLVSLAAPQFSQYGGEIEPGFDLTMSLPPGAPVGAEIYYTLDGSDPRQPGGALSPSAILYNGTIELNDTTQVQARVRSGSQWSPVVDKLFAVPEPYPLRVVELNYNPDTSEEHEFIELLNTGDSTISLDGVRIGGFSAQGYTFGGGLTLAPGARIVVARNPQAFQDRYGAQVNLAPGGYGDANLSNSGETVTLWGPLGELLQSFTYSDTSPWPSAADGDGSSLEYFGPFDQDAADPDDVAGDPYDDPANWRASEETGGNPGSGPGPMFPQLAGDYDNSGAVDESDYNKWRSQYGMLVTPGSESDGNGNGRVDAADYIVWRNNQGATAQAALLVIDDRPADSTPPETEPTEVGGSSGEADVAPSLELAFTDLSRHAQPETEPRDSSRLTAQPPEEADLLLLALRRPAIETGAVKLAAEVDALWEQWESLEDFDLRLLLPWDTWDA